MLSDLMTLRLLLCESRPNPNHRLKIYWLWSILTINIVILAKLQKFFDVKLDFNARLGRNQFNAVNV
jgi:hypothetical protein